MSKIGHFVRDSRSLNSSVPEVNFNPAGGKVYVNWYNLSNRNDNLRARSEVSVRKGVLSSLLYSNELFQ